jgi:hypothetical protein
MKKTKLKMRRATMIAMALAILRSPFLSFPDDGRGGGFPTGIPKKMMHHAAAKIDVRTARHANLRRLQGARR